MAAEVGLGAASRSVHGGRSSAHGSVERVGHCSGHSSAAFFAGDDLGDGLAGDLAGDLGDGLGDDATCVAGFGADAASTTWRRASSSATASRSASVASSSSRRLLATTVRYLSSSMSSSVCTARSRADISSICPVVGVTAVSCDSSSVVRVSTFFTSKYWYSCATASIGLGLATAFSMGLTSGEGTDASMSFNASSHDVGYGPVGALSRVDELGAAAATEPSPGAAPTARSSDTVSLFSIAVSIVPADTVVTSSALSNDEHDASWPRAALYGEYVARGLPSSTPSCADSAMEASADSARASAAAASSRFLAASASMRAASASAAAASTSSLRAVASLAASASRPARSTAAGEVRRGPVIARRADRFAAAAAAASARAAALSIMASTSRDTFVAASTRGAGEVRVGVAGSPPGEMDTERSSFDGSMGDEEISRSAMRSRASLIHSSASRPSADDFPVLHLEDVVVDVALSRCAAGVWKALSRPVERSSSKSSSPSSDEERASSPSARRRPVVDGDARAGDRHSSSRSQSSADRDPSTILEMLACGESARRRASDRAEKALAGLDGAEAASGDLARGLRVGESPSSSRARTSASGGVVGMFTP